MKGQAPIALSEGLSASRQAAGGTRQPRQALEDAGWQRQMASVEGFPDQDSENTCRQDP